MLALHEELTSGHLSFQKTYLKIRHRYFWTGMFTEIQQWCVPCVDCTTKKTPRNYLRHRFNLFRLKVHLMNKAINMSSFSQIILLTGRKLLPLRTLTLLLPLSCSSRSYFVVIPPLAHCYPTVVRSSYLK